MNLRIIGALAVLASSLFSADAWASQYGIVGGPFNYPVPLTCTRNFYVGPTGTDTPGCGSAPGTSACATIQGADANISLTGGDCVNVAAGTYNQGSSGFTLNKGGTANQANGYITYIGTGKCTSTGTSVSTCPTKLFWNTVLSNQGGKILGNFVAFENIEFDGNNTTGYSGYTASSGNSRTSLYATPGGILDDSGSGHHHMFFNSIGHGSGGQAWASATVIAGSELYDLAGSNPCDLSGISKFRPANIVGYAYNLPWDDYFAFKAINNVIHDIGTDQEANVLGAGNVGQCGPSHTDGNATIMDGWNANNYNFGALWAGNVIYNIGGGGLYILGASSGSAWLNNTVYNTGEDPSVARAPCTNTCGNTDSYENNICYTSGVNGTVAISQNQDTGFNQTPPLRSCSVTTATVWKNNLSFNGTPGQQSIQITNNPPNNTTYTNTFIANNPLLGTDPQLTNVTGNDFHPKSTSPTIRAGLPIASPLASGITFNTVLTAFPINLTVDGATQPNPPNVGALTPVSSSVVGAPDPFHYPNPLTCTRNFYVRPAGTDVAGCGTANTDAAACKTMQGADANIALTGGDCVNFAAGTYNTNGHLVLNKSGTSNQANGYITYVGAPNLTSKIFWNTPSFFGAQVVGSYVAFVGFEFDGNNLQGFGGYKPSNTNTYNAQDALFDSQGAGHHHIFVNNQMHGSGGAALGSTQDYEYAMGNEIYDMAGVNPCHTSAVSIYQPVSMVTPSGLPWDQNLYHFMYINNVIHDSGETAAETGTCPPQGTGHSDGNGLFFDSWGHQNDCSAPAYPYQGLMAGNVVYNIGGAGVYVLNSSNFCSPQTIAGPRAIFNNTAYNVGLDTGGSECVILFGAVSETWKNNLCYATHGETAFVWTTAGWQDNGTSNPMAQNLTFNGTVGQSDLNIDNGTNLTYFTGSTTLEGVDPKLTNVSALDFHPIAGSPVIGAGSSVLPTLPAAFPVLTPEGNPMPSPPPVGAFAPTGASPGISVSGNKLKDSNGNTVVLHGVDRAGTEYMCVGTTGTNGSGFFDTSINTLNDDVEVPLMKAWTGLNTVTLGINEDCWLGINGVPAAYSGANYINAIKHEVATLEANGIYPVISLFWTDNGTTSPALSQKPMADNPHSAQAWKSIATAFKGDPKVIFRAKEELWPAGNVDTTAAWDCWKNGDVQYDTSNTLTPVSTTSHCSEGFTTIGMQSMVNIIRGTGATNVIALSGVAFGAVATQFLNPTYSITDSLNPPQLMASMDVYPETSQCNTSTCWDSAYVPIIAVMPMWLGEIAENGGGSVANTNLVDALMVYFDAKGVGYSAWLWNTYGSQLITGYGTGTAATPWGVDFKAHLASLISPGSVPLINAGGPAAAPYAADTGFTGGTATSNNPSGSVDTSLVFNPAPTVVYRTERYGNPFTYTVGGLTPNTHYSVRLHFTEDWAADESVGKRVENITINGTQVLANFDIFATAGAANKAVAKSFNSASDSSGNIAITFNEVTGSAEPNAKVDAIEVEPLPTASLSASVQSVTGGGSSTLTWASTNSTRCTGTGFSTGGATSGSLSVTPATTTSYSVSCDEGGIAASATQIVTVFPVTTASLTAAPSTILNGQSTTLTWSTNGTRCIGTGFSTGNATSGSLSVSPTLTTNYSVACDAGGVPTSKMIQVTVNPVTDSLVANPATITNGNSTTLSWSTNGTRCVGAGFSTGNAPSGSLPISPITTTPYSVSCDAGGAATLASITVTVNPVGPPSPQKSLSALRTEISSFFADNTTGAITPSVLRSVMQDFLDSVGFNQYTVATLPAGSEGMQAYATDGRKAGEAAGLGTGVPVYFSNGIWRVFTTNAQVTS